MSLATSALLSTVKEPFPKVISPKAHGFIDYGHAMLFFGLGLLCSKHNKRAAMAAFGTGAFVLVESLLTDYPLGLKPVIPFATHGTMDAGFASASWAIPKLFGFSGTPAAKVFQINSAVEATVVELTDFSSERARRDRLKNTHKQSTSSSTNSNDRVSRAT